MPTREEQRKERHKRFLEKLDERMRKMLWYNRDEPRLNELVFILVHLPDDTSFQTLLTRVPGVGEEINTKDHICRVTRVRHYEVDDMGRARLGWHASLYAELIPLEFNTDEQPRRRRRSKKPT